MNLPDLNSDSYKNNNYYASGEMNMNGNLIKGSNHSESGKPSFDFSYTRSNEDKNASLLSEQANALLKDLVAFKGKFRSSLSNEYSLKNKEMILLNTKTEKDENFVSEDIRKLLEIIKYEKMEAQYIPNSDQHIIPHAENKIVEDQIILQEQSKYLDEYELNQDAHLTSVYSQFSRYENEDFRSQKSPSHVSPRKESFANQRKPKKTNVIEFNPKLNTKNVKRQSENKENSGRNLPQRVNL